MANETKSPNGMAQAPREGDEVERPDFVSEDVWRVVQLAARTNNVPVQDYVEKALLDEALILEQVRYGRRWLVRNERGDVGEVDFG